MVSFFFFLKVRPLHILDKKNVHFAYVWMNVIHDFIVFHEHVHFMMKILTTRYVYAKPNLRGCSPRPRNFGGSRTQVDKFVEI